MADTPIPQGTTLPPGTCRACKGRGYIGEPFKVYEQPRIGEPPSPFIRHGVETCPACKGSGRDER